MDKKSFDVLYCWLSLNEKRYALPGMVGCRSHKSLVAKTMGFRWFKTAGAVIFAWQVRVSEINGMSVLEKQMCAYDKFTKLIIEWLPWGVNWSPSKRT